MIKGAAAFHIASRSLFVLFLIALYAITLSWLSLERHAAHLSNALDLGYYSNTLWNTIHGLPFRFTTYHAANFVFPEFDPNTVRKPDNLLAYHVEPILLPLALIYAVWPDPRALLILQTLVLASGAWPAYQIARRRLAPRTLAPLVFPAIYLISPSLIGANLSDFHPVSFSAAMGLWAFDALERRAYGSYFVCVALLLSLKEEMGLLVALLGLYALFAAGRGRKTAGEPRRQLVRAGLATIAVAAVWTGVAILIQRDAAGRQISLFAARYVWLGHTPREILLNALTTPALFDWLRQPEVYGYLGYLLAQTGFAALLAPELLLVAAPEVALNAFSSFDWQRSGLAHYSAPIVAWLVIAAIVGTARVERWRLEIGDSAAAPLRGWRLDTPNRVLISNLQSLISNFLPSIILLSAAFQADRAGQLPLAQDFAPFDVSAHDRRLAGVVAQIPPGAKVSAQSDLYSHVPERADLYLFPTIADADYIVLDVTGQTYPIQPAEYVDSIKQILNDSPAGIVAAADGYLLFARSTGRKDTLPDSFFSFVRPTDGDIRHPLAVMVGDGLELLGYDFEWLPPRQVAAPIATIRTYWRALRPIDDRLRFVYRLYAPDGALANAEHGSPTERWLPNTRWRPGEVYVIEQRAVQAPRGTKIGVRVESGDAVAPVVEQPDAPSEELIEEGVIRLLVAE